MRSKHFIGLALCIILLLSTGDALFSQNQPPPMLQERDYSEDAILKSLDEFKQLEQVNSRELGPQLDDLKSAIARFGQEAAKIKSDKIVRAILEFPVHDPGIVEAKLNAFYYFDECPPGVHDLAVNSLYNSSPDVQAAATRVLSKWGIDMDEVFPVIHQLGNYLALNHAPKTPEIEAFLREGIQTSTWESRMYAALVLQSYGDSLTTIDVSKEVLENTPSSADDKSIARARSVALNMLVRLARNGISEAAAALEVISNTSTDPWLRDTAKQNLNLLRGE